MTTRKLYVCTANTLKSKALESISMVRGDISSSAGIEGWPNQEGYPSKNYLNKIYGKINPDFVKKFIQKTKKIYGEDSLKEIDEKPKDWLIENFDKIYTIRQNLGINPFLLKVLEEKGYKIISKLPVQLNDELIETAKEIIGVSENHYRQIIKLFPSSLKKLSCFESDYKIKLPNVEDIESARLLVSKIEKILDDR